MIQLNGVTKVYGIKNLKHIVLNDVNLKIRQGEMLGIIGKSGCGK